MKAAAFELVRPADLAEASALLVRPGARAMAGGQSLGPMLNLRVAQPELIVPITHLPELREIVATESVVTIGACVTHATIADGDVPDIGLNILARVAEGIAYRAVRTRGTIGGSLCHADPAADWVTVLTALGASVLTSTRRTLALGDFVTGTFRVTLQPGELLRAVRIPRLSGMARWGYVKACRKPGEFAHAMAAVLVDRGVIRAVIGATGGVPIVLEGDAVTRDPPLPGLDPIDAHIQLVVLHRALAQAGVA
ncbi:MAG TPA: FAD binding domain-containing protein [Acetobacteraceae bacterium]|jgi:carbon-monoxide dehydrogenase medium subunit|nr:FAD binding domain-containing protein [Acetobacteraceae bacterium]